MPITYEFCHKLPKCELHAHLNGSIRISTLNELVEIAIKNNPNASGVEIIQDTERTLDECFRIFDIIYKVVVRADTITRIMKETLEDFAKDNVAYCEIRTTPRRDIGAGPNEYIQAAIKGMIQYEKEARKNNTTKNPSIVTKSRLLLSISRTASLEDAMETVELAKKYFRYGDNNENNKKDINRVVGIEVSGNPKLGNFSTYLPALKKARTYGIPISVHTGEVYKPMEVTDILNFQPDRLGHGLHLEPVHMKKLLFEKQIPIEICPTSNTMNLELNDLSEHPKLGIWLKNNYPISFNTDDSVLFNTTLTNEYYNVAKTFNLNEFEIEQLCRNVWDQIFDVNVKHEMMMKNNNNNISRY